MCSQSIHPFIHPYHIIHPSISSKPSPSLCLILYLSLSLTLGGQINLQPPQAHVENGGHEGVNTALCVPEKECECVRENVCVACEREREGEKMERVVGSRRFVFSDEMHVGPWVDGGASLPPPNTQSRTYSSTPPPQKTPQHPPTLQLTYSSTHPTPFPEHLLSNTHTPCSCAAPTSARRWRRRRRCGRRRRPPGFWPGWRGPRRRSCLFFFGVVWWEGGFGGGAWIRSVEGESVWGGREEGGVE